LISLKFSKEFPDAVFLGVDVESLVGEVGVSSLVTRVPVRKCHNFGSDRLISLNFSQEFPEAVFLGVDVESQLGEEKVL
jgi:tRNA G46 methylase TrmB